MDCLIPRGGVCFRHVMSSFLIRAVIMTMMDYEDLKLKMSMDISCFWTASGPQPGSVKLIPLLFPVTPVSDFP